MEYFLQINQTLIRLSFSAFLKINQSPEKVCIWVTPIFLRNIENTPPLKWPSGDFAITYTYCNQW
jgi:hypothetical protein